MVATAAIAVVASFRKSEKVPPWEQEAVAAGVAHVLSLLLDEAGWGVIWRTGHYTRNIAAALHENHLQLRQMITEKVRSDPAAANSIGLLPFHERIIEQITESMLRVAYEVLNDPRTDELVSDMLRDNIDQIRAAVNAKLD